MSAMSTVIRNNSTPRVLGFIPGTGNIGVDKTDSVDELRKLRWE